jgi:RNA polymerase sigma-70 factor (ECF subfamily)
VGGGAAPVRPEYLSSRTKCQLPTAAGRDIFLNGQTRCGVYTYRGKRGVTGACVSALIARAEVHTPEAGFGERITENQRRVFQIAYSILGNSADAEDVAQEAFLRAYQKFDSLREAEKFRAWVNRIVFRLALNRRRGYRRRLARDTAWQIAETRTMVDGAKDAEQQVLLDRLRREIERLPEKFQSVLRLSLVEEMDAADVGAVLGIPAGTVRSRLHTARKLLLEVMK